MRCYCYAYSLAFRRAAGIMYQYLCTLAPVNIGILMFIVLIAFISRLLKLAGGLIAPCVKLALLRWLVVTLA